MAIQKQEFYEGAALYMLAREGGLSSIRYEHPIFVVNGALSLLLKYSTKIRSPWGFTFACDEREMLDQRSIGSRVIIGLVCGSDGVATLDYRSFAHLVPTGKSAIHVSCYRQHGEYYEISGPKGSLDKKVAPSEWRQLVRTIQELQDEAL